MFADIATAIITSDNEECGASTASNDSPPVKIMKRKVKKIGKAFSEEESMTKIVSVDPGVQAFTPTPVSAFANAQLN